MRLAQKVITNRIGDGRSQERTFRGRKITRSGCSRRTQLAGILLRRHQRRRGQRQEPQAKPNGEHLTMQVGEFESPPHTVCVAHVRKRRRFSHSEVMYGSRKDVVNNLKLFIITQRRQMYTDPSSALPQILIRIIARSLLPVTCFFTTYSNFGSEKLQVSLE